MGLHIAQILTLSLPILSFFDQHFIYNNTHFLAVVLLIIFYFYTYPMEPLHNKLLQKFRKYTVLVCGSWLTIIIVSQLQDIIKDVYNLEYSYELMFITKIVLILVNAQIGISGLQRTRNDVSLPL